MPASAAKRSQTVKSLVKRFLLGGLAVLNLFALDQIAKAAAIAYLKDSPPVKIIDGFANFAYVENRGAAWGLFQGHVWPLALFAIIAACFIVWKSESIFGRTKFGKFLEIILLAGIAGNLCDRLRLGCVIDFIDCHWLDKWHFPCFNIADVYITAAAAGLIYLALKGDGGKSPAKQNKQQPVR